MQVNPWTWGWGKRPQYKTKKRCNERTAPWVWWCKMEIFHLSKLETMLKSEWKPWKVFVVPNIPLMFEGQLQNNTKKQWFWRKMGQHHEKTVPKRKKKANGKLIYKVLKRTCHCNNI